MASPTSVPYFSREALKAVVELADERDRNDPLMSLFPRRLHMGDKVTVRTMTRRPQRVRHTSRDGKGYTVQPGTLSETTYSPAWFKPQAQVKAGDLDAFYAAEAAVGQTDDRSAALVNDADRRIMRLMEPLLADTALERKHAMAGALQGSYTYKVDDLAQTVSYGLTALTAPGTTWTNAASTILANIRAALSEFFELYGLECDTIFYGRKVADDFATNTQIQTLFGGSEFYARAQLEQRLNPVTGGALGLGMGVGDGITWIPVLGKSQPIGGGSTTDIWNRTKLVLAHRASMGGEWSMTYSPTYGIVSESPNVEIMRPVDGADVKSPLIQVYDNGIPTFERPDAVATWTVEF